jgi:hypothetical protein
MVRQRATGSELNVEVKEQRAEILRGGPSLVGGAWVKSLCTALAEQGREVAGGWPGTIVEARALIDRHLHVELGKCGLRHASSAELALAAEATYARARSEWLGLERSARAAIRGRAPRA